MILSTHHFWGHVARCTRSLRGIVRAPIACDTEIGKAQIAIALEHKILWLDISVNDTSTMNLIKCFNETSDEEFGLSL